jgi:hypothetical protein
MSMIVWSILRAGVGVFRRGGAMHLRSTGLIRVAVIAVMSVGFVGLGQVGGTTAHAED